MRTVKSTLPEATNLPSGEQASEVTAASCALVTAETAKVPLTSTEYMTIVMSSDPEKRMRFSGCLKDVQKKESTSTHHS